MGEKENPPKMRTILCLAAVLAVSQGGKLDVEGRRMRSPVGTKAGPRVGQQMLKCYDLTSGGGDIVTASGSQELRMTGSMTLSTSTSMTISSVTRNSPTTPCLS